MLDLVAVVAVALAGGCLPLLARWSERHLHTALALSTGIFLGAVFLHFLPSLSGMRLSGPPEAHGGDPWLWLFVLLGVLAVYFVEALVLRTHDHDDRHRHRAVGVAALVGLTVHALTAGLGFGAASQEAAVSGPMLVAILAHKGFETFALTTVFQLAGVGRRRILVTVAAFALVTPVGMAVGDQLARSLGQTGLAILTALAAGTFLYVCLCELLTEVFHHREDSLRKIALLTLGMGVMVLFEALRH